MSAGLEAQKAELRSRMRIVLSGAAAARTDRSMQACARLERQRIWQDARSILFFAPLPAEPDVWPMLERSLVAGRTVALPRFSTATQSYEAAQIRDLGRDVCAGRFGIREPAARCARIPLDQLQLVLVPGMAFDPGGHRLGRGKGFYDRMLAGVRGVKCGVAFDEQMVAAVPAGPQDMRVDFILTPARWIEIPARNPGSDFSGPA